MLFDTTVCEHPWNSNMFRLPQFQGCLIWTRTPTSRFTGQNVHHSQLASKASHLVVAFFGIGRLFSLRVKLDRFESIHLGSLQSTLMAVGFTSSQAHSLFHRGILCWKWLAFLLQWKLQEGKPLEPPLGFRSHALGDSLGDCFGDLDLEQEKVGWRIPSSFQHIASLPSASSMTEVPTLLT